MTPDRLKEIEELATAAMDGSWKSAMDIITIATFIILMIALSPGIWFTLRDILNKRKKRKNNDRH